MHHQRILAVEWNLLRPCEDMRRCRRIDVTDVLSRHLSPPTPDRSSRHVCYRGLATIMGFQHHSAVAFLPSLRHLHASNDFYCRFNSLGAEHAISNPLHWTVEETCSFVSPLSYNIELTATHARHTLKPNYI